MKYIFLAYLVMSRIFLEIITPIIWVIINPCLFSGIVLFLMLMYELISITFGKKLIKAF